MNHELLAAMLTALISATSGTGILGLVLSKKQSDKDREREDREKARDKEITEAEKARDKEADQARDWYQESRSHYKTAKDEAAEARKECADCKKQLRHDRGVIYTLLEDLEDQIIPMLGLAGTDPVQIRQAMRAVIHKAREAL